MTKSKHPKIDKYAPQIVLVLRLVVGVVFAFSGFVKAIDPWGMLYKLEDYSIALACEWLSPFLLFGAFAISIFEFVLGVCLLIGAYRHVSVYLSFLFMLIMTPLSLWLAITNAVPDCGCFGDAIVLGNTTTFVKNILLLVAVLYLMRHNVKVANFYSPSIQWIITLLTIVYISVIAAYGYFYQPMIDFRPYKTGQSITNIEYSSGADESIVFVYEKNGETHEFKLSELPDDIDSTWSFIERREPEAYLSKRTESSGIVVTDGNDDVTEEVLKNEGEQLIFVFSDMYDINITYTYLINIIDDLARQLNVDIIGVTGANDDEIADWVDMSMATYPIYRVDDTELKVLARGKPAVVFMRDGKVVWKRTLQSISATRVEEAINGGGDLEWVASDYNGYSRLKICSYMYILAMFIILFLNRSNRVYKFSTRLIKKNQK